MSSPRLFLRQMYFVSLRASNHSNVNRILLAKMKTMKQLVLYLFLGILLSVSIPSAGQHKKVVDRIIEIGKTDGGSVR